MSKGGKMFDVIMITIIIIASLNYADYIKVDMKLMMVLLAIALYVTAKQNQKTQHSKKVEPLDGSTVAFDKEAFVNLNNIVNQLVKKDSVTIPGNLIVMGTTTMEKDLNVKTTATVDGTTTCNGEFVCEGRSSFKMRDGVYSHINEGGICKIRSKLLLDAWGKSDATFECHGIIARGGISARESITADNDITAKSSLSAGQNLVVGGATTLKGTLNVTGQTTCNTTTISGLTVTGTTTLKNTLNVTGDIKASGNAYANAFLYKNNGNQGLLFNQGDRQIRLASGTANAMLDFDGSQWLLSYAANSYFEFSSKNLGWLQPDQPYHGAKWSY